MKLKLSPYFAALDPLPNHCYKSLGSRWAQARAPEHPGEKMEESMGLIGMVGGLVSLAFAVLMIASVWKIFTKAGKPGWACLVPIYNIIVWLDIIGKPLWWIILLFIPVVNFVIAILLTVGLAKSFGKDIGFAIGLLLVGPIFYPMLAFGDAAYVGTAES